MLTIALLVTIACFSAPVIGVPSFDCVMQPTLQLEAGVSNLTNMVNLPLGRQCEATLYFSDPSFLPMTFSFNATSCEQKQINTFQVPSFSPNGEVDVIWRCSNMATSCSHAEVIGGQFNSSMARHMSGEVGCLQEMLQTRTTLITHTRTSGTTVKTVSTIVTIPTTVYSALTTSLSKAKTQTLTLDTKTSPTTQDMNAQVKAQSTQKCPESLTCSPVPTVGVEEDLSADGPATPAIMTPLATEEVSSAGMATSKVPGDTVFVNSGPGTMIPAVTVSIFTTITATVTHSM